MFFVLALAAGSVAATWPKGWIAVAVLTLWMAATVAMEVANEDGMSAWLVPLATAVTLGLGLIGFAATRFVIRRRQALQI